MNLTGTPSLPAGLPDSCLLTVGRLFLSRLWPFSLRQPPNTVLTLQNLFTNKKRWCSLLRNTWLMLSVCVCLCVGGRARSHRNRTAARESPLSLEDECEDVLLAAEDPVACALGSCPRCKPKPEDAGGLDSALPWPHATWATKSAVALTGLVLPAKREHCRTPGQISPK